MRLGVIPAPNSGLASMNATGQLARLFRHLGYYAEHFDLTYVTWGDPEAERRLWQPFEDKTGARLVTAHRYAALRDCDVLRCLNLHATMAAMPTRRPYVMSYGADYPALAAIHGRPAWKWKALRAVAVRRARTVLVPNERMALALMDRYPYAGIVHHPNWVDCEMFAPRDLRHGGRGFHVLSVGRLVKEKNLEALALAVRRLDPPAGLICLGEGPLKARLRALGAICYGAEAWERLPAWYHCTDVFALPSLSEGHPKALTEAMASGMPCLVSQAVTEGGFAVLRTDDLVAGLRRLLEPKLADEYAAAARAWALARWDVKMLMPKEIGYLRAAAWRDATQQSASKGRFGGAP